MTYCVGIITRDGFVVASDSRSNAGLDQVNVCRKMHIFERPGDRVFVLAASGSLSCTQSVVTLLGRDFDQGLGLATVETFYDAARVVGETIRQVAKLDREALERDDFKFNVHLILAGQIRGHTHDLYMIYPQGNPLKATEDSPFLQIGECKYGRPILDRGVRYRPHDPRRRGALCPDLAGFDDAVQRHGRAADRPGHLRPATTCGSPAPAGSWSGTRTSWPIHTHWEQALRKAVQEAARHPVRRGRKPGP